MVTKINPDVAYYDKYETAGITAENSFNMKGYSSNLFSEQFMDTPFPPSVKWSMFDNTAASDDLENRIFQITNQVNEQGGWIVTGWSKRGEINDVTMSEDGHKEKNRIYRGKTSCDINQA